MDASHVLLDGQTELLHEQWIEGRRPPRMKMTGRARKLFKRLHRERPAGWLAERERALAAERRGRNPRVVVLPRRPAARSS